MTTPHLNISELFNMRNRAESRRNETYNVILGRCHNHIRKAAKNGAMECLFEIPSIMIGYPIYDIKMAKAYCMEKLAEDGMRCKDSIGNYIVISWNPLDNVLKKPTNTGGGSDFLSEFDLMTPVTRMPKAASPKYFVRESPAMARGEAAPIATPPPKKKNVPFHYF